MGRVTHDYGFYKRGSYSINAAHSSTTVRYLSVRERVEILENVHWIIRADLEHGFRQFGTHPKDWRYQVYCNGPREHYIDLACPFGKTNSTLEFCPPVALFAKSVVARFKEHAPKAIPVLGSYVDDIFGGLEHEASYRKALAFRKYVCDTGTSLSLRFNMKVHKTPLPARRQVVLGCLYDSVDRHVRMAEKKRVKYIDSVRSHLKSSSTTLKALQKLHGYLNFAAEVAPFGRPFLANLTNAMSRAVDKDQIVVTEGMKRSLRIWLRILMANRGVSFDFVLGKLRRGTHDIFVDASTEWGIGGCYGRFYFMFPWSDLEAFGADFIARKELLAAMVSLFCFQDMLMDTFVYIISDNQNAVQ